jgi:putative transposase
MASMVRAVLSLWISLFQSAAALFRSRRDQAIVKVALRQQLEIYARRDRRPRLSPLDRAFWVALSRLWPRWKSVLVVVQPETVVRWHQRRFRAYWRSISTPGSGRPPISEEIRALIARMASRRPLVRHSERPDEY